MTMDLDQVERAERKLEFLQKRELERLSKQQYKKDTLDVQSENVVSFLSSFKETEKEILNLIENSQSVSKDKLPAYFDNISKQILILQTYIANSNLFLRSYDVEVYHKVIVNLNMQLKETEAQLMPKKKFGFRSKKTEPVKNDVVDSKLRSCSQTKEIKLDENYCGYKNEENKCLQLSGVDVLKKDVSLGNLTNCTVFIHGAPSTLHISNATKCTIYSGPVSTSIFADNCIDSTLHLSCQQLRLHSSTMVDIYLHVTSRAIMEDCTHIQFAPYTYNYDSIDKDFVNAGLDCNINNWQLIDDFNWLNSEKKSPNWSILEPSKECISNNPEHKH